MENNSFRKATKYTPLEPSEKTKRSLGSRLLYYTSVALVVLLIGFGGMLAAGRPEAKKALSWLNEGWNRIIPHSQSAPAKNRFESKTSYDAPSRLNDFHGIPEERPRGHSTTISGKFTTFIVMFDDKTSIETVKQVAEDVKQKYGAKINEIYETLRGFAYSVPSEGNGFHPDQNMGIQSMAALSARPDVVSVEEDQVMYALEEGFISL